MHTRLSVLLIVGLLLAACTSDYGTEAEAKEMLERVVAELKQDPVAALTKFNQGEEDFRDRDLYPFCFREDGTVTAHPTEKGRDIRQMKDTEGKAFGREMLRVAEEGQFKKVTYLWPKPGGTEPMPKVSYITKVGDQICGVGYYTR